MGRGLLKFKNKKTSKDIIKGLHKSNKKVLISPNYEYQDSFILYSRL